MTSDSLSGGEMMESLLKLHIQKLPEGVYLATSEDLPGLVAQGRTISETLEIARDVARKLIEARMERNSMSNVLQPIADQFDYPLVVGGIG
jgi:predicted RNase H-like HicB family nuclease